MREPESVLQGGVLHVCKVFVCICLLYLSFVFVFCLFLFYLYFVFVFHICLLYLATDRIGCPQLSPKGEEEGDQELDRCVTHRVNTIYSIQWRFHHEKKGTD